jgi:hypothetical protein
MQVSDLNTPPALHPSPPKRAYGIQEAGWAPRDGLGSMAKMKKSPHFPYRKLNPGCPARSLVTILRYTRFHAALDTRGGGKMYVACSYLETHLSIRGYYESNHFSVE